MQKIDETPEPEPDADSEAPDDDPYDDRPGDV
jgi:hypothetical protein